MHRYEMLKQDHDLNIASSKENIDSAKQNCKSKLSDIQLPIECNDSSKTIKNGSTKGIQSVSGVSYFVKYLLKRFHNIKSMINSMS